jgi:hypothetical protein
VSAAASIFATAAGLVSRREAIGAALAVAAATNNSSAVQREGERPREP